MPFGQEPSIGASVSTASRRAGEVTRRAINSSSKVSCANDADFHDAPFLSFIADGTPYKRTPN
jgi:hypothetical protein